MEWTRRSAAGFEMIHVGIVLGRLAKNEARAHEQTLRFLHMSGVFVLCRTLGLA